MRGHQGQSGYCNRSNLNVSRLASMPVLGSGSGVGKGTGVKHTQLSCAFGVMACYKARTYVCELAPAHTLMFGLVGSKQIGSRQAAHVADCQVRTGGGARGRTGGRVACAATPTNHIKANRGVRWIVPGQCGGLINMTTPN